MPKIAHYLAETRARIDGAASRAGREPSTVKLVAISKTFPAEAIAEALAAGQRAFGENRVQEAEPKIRSLEPGSGIEWHLVGHLQSNKARRAAELFDVIHSIDSVKVARKLDQAAAELGRTLHILVQVDLGGEATKSGASRGEVGELVAALAGLGALRLQGLMTLPPFFDDPEKTRPFFAELRQMRDDLQQRLGRALELSMGMSHDFEVAISEGATIVRIGTAIFGSREA